MSEPQAIRSRDNPMLARVRRLVQDGAAYRRLGQVWVEGDHLCGALRTRGWPARLALITEEAWQHGRLRELAGWAQQIRVLPAALFAGISALESPAAIGFVLDMPGPEAMRPGCASIVLDRLQDPGNVGSVLRSAAAFGCTQVLAIKGTAALWSPKVLRAGMGAHFGLRLLEGLDEADLAGMAVPLVAADPHAGPALHESRLPRPCAWVLGHEGQGVSASLLAACRLRVRIPQPGGEESLNVAAAAAVVLYESSRQALPGGSPASGPVQTRQ
ncbi:MAG TPA: RNA methyltransferase [Rubrivivax sp.]|nr:RNA methyltransferase [Rubrivivax sp.]